MVHYCWPNDNVQKELSRSRHLVFISTADDVAAKEDCRLGDAVEDKERVGYELGADDLELGSSLNQPIWVAGAATTCNIAYPEEI